MISLNELHTYFDLLVLVGFSIAAFVLISSVFIKSPYGKFSSNRYGLELDPRLGWWLMEIMATVSFVYFYVQGPQAHKPVPLLFASLFLIHYGNRGWYFPFNLNVQPGTKSSFSIIVVVCGFIVTSLHGFLNATWYGRIATFLDWDYFFSVPCLTGLLVYQVGFWSTIRCEYIMRHLRDSSPERYCIPRGFLFEYVSSPQYMCELVGFAGWTLMTLNPAGAVIFCISFANLVPRALQSHAWYREKFKDYPRERKALIPFIV